MPNKEYRFLLISGAQIVTQVDITNDIAQTIAEMLDIPWNHNANYMSERNEKGVTIKLQKIDFIPTRPDP